MPGPGGNCELLLAGDGKLAVSGFLIRGALLCGIHGAGVLHIRLAHVREIGHQLPIVCHNGIGVRIGVAFQVFQTLLLLRIQSEQADSRPPLAAAVIQIGTILQSRSQVQGIHLLPV